MTRPEVPIPLQVWRATRLASKRSDEAPDEDTLTLGERNDRAERTALGDYCGRRR